MHVEMIGVVINGEKRTVSGGVTLSSLLRNLGFEGKRFAVEVNEEIVPRSQHSSWHIKRGDQIEIVQAIGGG